MKSKREHRQEGLSKRSKGRRMIRKSIFRLISTLMPSLITKILITIWSKTLQRTSKLNGEQIKQKITKTLNLPRVLLQIKNQKELLISKDLILTNLLGKTSPYRRINMRRLKRSVTNTKLNHKLVKRNKPRRSRWKNNRISKEKEELFFWIWISINKSSRIIKG